MKVSELKGAQLAYWVAQIDPACARLRWERQGEHWIGYGRIGSSPEFPCLFITEAADDGMAALLHAPRYVPYENWAQGGPLMDHFDVGAIRLLPDSPEGAWLAMKNPTIGPSYEIEGEVEQRGNAQLEACMRCILASVYGEDVPEVEVTS